MKEIKLAQLKMGSFVGISIYIYVVCASISPKRSIKGKVLCGECTAEAAHTPADVSQVRCNRQQILRRATVVT